MKIFQITCLAVALVFGTATLTSISGCSTANTAAYKVASTTQVAVSTAMTLWGSYVSSQKQAGKPVPVEVEAKVKAAYVRYQQAAAAVCDAGALWAAASSTNSAGATGLQNVFDQAVMQMNQTIADLEALIASFGVKLS